MTEWLYLRSATFSPVSSPLFSQQPTPITPSDSQVQCHPYSQRDVVGTQIENAAVKHGWAQFLSEEYTHPQEVSHYSDRQTGYAHVETSVIVGHFRHLAQSLAELSEDPGRQNEGKQAQ